MGRSTRRGPWLPEEDGTLLQLVHIQGPNNWVRISQHMQHRSPKQCRERYHQNLKPSLNHEPISPEEGEVIEQLVQDMGKRWAEIARRLGNRSDNAVKNWWNGSMNRRKRNNVPNGPVSHGVGPRSQPIPATTPPRPDRIFGPRLNFEAGEGQSFVAFPRLERLPSDRERRIDTGYFYHPQASSPPLQPERETNLRSTSLPQPHVPRPDLRGLPPLLASHSAPTSVHNTPDPFSMRSLNPQPNPQGLLLPPLESRHSYHSEWHRPRAHGVEPSAISPAVTEFSNLPSVHQAPSLISDDQSQYSISPKTVSSPRPVLPALIDTSNARIWNLDQRRNSYTPYTLDNKSYPQDEGYVSALPPSTTTESANSGFPLGPSLKRYSPQPEPKSPAGVRVLGSSALSPTERDSRMNVSRLLE